MARGAKSMLGDLIKEGLVDDGEVLRYKNKNGRLMLVGRARSAGIEVKGSSAPLKYSAFEERAGSTYRRPAEHIQTTASRTLQAAQRSLKGGAADGASAPAAVGRRTGGNLLDDLNDEFCHVCGLGGDLVCCESCPGTFHTSCIGLAGLPEDEWHCPGCRCTECGHANFSTAIPPILGPVRTVPCPSYASPSGGTLCLTQAAVILKADPTAANGLQPAALEHSGLLNPMQVPQSMQVDVNEPLDPGASGPCPPATKTDASGLPGTAEVRCSGGGVRVHYGCLKEPSNLIVSSRLEPWYSDASTAEECLKLAEVSAAGAVPFGTLHNGMPLSLQLIRGAAVAGTACSGACPAYSEAQRVELRAALSAALCVLQSGYGAIPDSRTGGDMLLWMVRGARFADGAMDLSGMYTAVLFVGSTIAGAACLRLLGRGTAELPVLTVRPEVRGAGLGTAMISRIESILLEAGVKVLLTPALTMWRGPYMPSVLLHGQPLPPPGQQAWGYCLATKAQMRSVLALRPITMPGVLLATKNLSQATILKPRVAHPTLGLDSIAAVSHRQLMQGNFIRAEAVAAAPGAPAYGGGAPTGIAGPSNGGIFGGIAVKAEEANGVGALQHQAQGMNGMIEAAPFMPADGFNTAAQGATVGNGSLTDRLMASLTADEAMN